jgi:hypothetical protein
MVLLAFHPFRLVRPGFFLAGMRYISLWLFEYKIADLLESPKLCDRRAVEIVTAGESNGRSTNPNAS